MTTPISSSEHSEELKNVLSPTTITSVVRNNGSIDEAGGDEAIKYADVQVELTDEVHRRLIFKADLYICSLMCFVYAIQFMDKVSNASAAIMGLRTDLKMEGDMYAWVGSSFYLGYLVFEIPVNLVLQRFHLGHTTGIFIALWGIVLAASGGCTSYAPYIVTRVLLGALEGAITPAFLRLTTQYYTKNEHFSRVNLWFACNGLGTIIGNAIAYGLWVHQEAYSIAGWRVLFIVFGLITVVLGAVFYVLVPNSPAGARWLSDFERAAQTERIRINQQGYGSHQIKWDQVKETFLDVRTYLYFAIVFLTQLPNGGLTNFQSLLYKGMGFTTKKTLLISMGSGAVQVVGCSLTGILSLYVLNKWRLVYANIGAALGVMCFGLLAYAPTNSGKIAALMLNSWVIPVSFIALLSLISSNSAGSTKKSLSGGLLLVAYCAGNVVGPQTFKTSEAPTYQTAKVIMLACGSVNVALFLVLLWVNWAENRRRDARNETLPDHIKNSEFADLTDFENPEFRYSL